jgi:hypothetical protein
MKKEEVKISDLKEGNISLILDSYNDIFSSFDPRSYSEKALSDDFLVECKRASLERSEPIVLRLLIPKNKRNFQEESKIKFRLKNHFYKHYLEKKKEINKLKLNGALFIFFGLLMMFVAYLTYSNFLFSDEILKNILLVITEPAGWFFFWIGGEKFVYRVSEIYPKYEFYHKMISSKVQFLSY